MALELGMKVTQTTEVDELIITSFTFDMVNTNILVIYDEMDNHEVVSKAKSVLFDKAQTIEAISHAGFIAQLDVYPPIKAALYKGLSEITGVNGVVM